MSFWISHLRLIYCSNWRTSLSSLMEWASNGRLLSSYMERVHELCPWGRWWCHVCFVCYPKWLFILEKYQKTKIDMIIFKCTPMRPLSFIPTCTLLKPKPKYNYNCTFDMEILKYQILTLISKYYNIIRSTKSQYLDFFVYDLYKNNLKP